jgi:hypothetical protein
MKKKLLISIPILIVVAIALIMFLPSSLARADFNSSDIIDDYTYNDTGTMNASQINSFLNDFSSSCISPNNGFQAPDPTGYSPSGGFTYGGNTSAGQVIYDAAQTYGLNPQVLITTLEKEQSLVTGNAGCSILRYTGAAGYGCPDGGNQYSYSGVDLYSIHGSEVTSVNGTCVNSAAKAGFSEQIIHAAWLLAYSEQRSQGNVTWDVQLTNSPEPGDVWNNSDDPESCYSGPMTEGTFQVCPGGSSVFYDGYTTIDGTSTYMSDGATAALYDYTPHFSGNENFDDIFQEWFGPTTGQGFELAISDTCTSACPQYVVYDNMKQYVPSSQILDAWGLENVTLTTMPAAQLNALPSGSYLGRVMMLAGSLTVYFVDGGHRYEIPYPSTYSAWNFASIPKSYVSAALFNLPSYAGNLGYDVQAPNSSTIYMLDGADPNNGQTILRPFANQTVFDAWEGSNAPVLTLDSASNYFSVIDNDVGGTIASTNATFDGDNFQVMNQYALQEPANILPLYSGGQVSVSAATFGRLLPGGTMSPLIEVMGSPNVYMVDNGEVHQIVGQTELVGWTYPGEYIVQVNSAFLSDFTVGASISGYIADSGGQMYVMDNGVKIYVPSNLQTAYGNTSSNYDASSALLALYPQRAAVATSFIKSYSSPNIYLLNDSSQLEQFSQSAELFLWGGNQVNVTNMDWYVVNPITVSGVNPATFVTDGTNNYVIDSGQKWTVSSPVQSDWGISNPQVYSDGTLNMLPTGGALGANLQDGSGSYYMIAGGNAYATSDPSIANLWGLSSAPVHEDALVTTLVTAYELDRFVESSTNSSNNYVIDNGNWYSMTSTEAAELGATGQPETILNPSLAPNSITPWTSFMVQDGGGNYWVIDGGIKRFAPTSAIINQWDDNGGISVPTVTNGFLNEMPTGAAITKSIKSASNSNIYAVTDGQLDLILYPSTYQSEYAPYSIVSNALLNSLPSGPNITN